MKKSDFIDCPALHKKGDGYPFGDRVPKRVRLIKTVRPDFIPGLGTLSVRGCIPIAPVDSEQNVYTNSYGAVSAVFGDDVMLGLKPDEFEVIEWHELTGGQ